MTTLGLYKTENEILMKLTGNMVKNKLNNARNS